MIKLYMDYMSQPSRAVLALCLIAKIPVQIMAVRVDRKQTRRQQFLEIFPMGKVPAIFDGSNNFKLAESHTIMRYLYRKHPLQVGEWYAHGDYLRQSKIDQYLDFHHTNTRKCEYYLHNALFAKNHGATGDPYFVQQSAKKDVVKALQLIQKHFIGSNLYIVGNTPTIADLSAFFQIQFLSLCGQNFQKWTNIKNWLKRMSQIQQIKQADKVFLKLYSKIAPKETKSVFQS